MNLLADRCKSFFSILETEKVQKYIFIIVLVLIFVGLLLTNLIFPLINDDFIYSYALGEDRKLTGLGDIITSQYKHYFEWGGRSIVHFIAQFLLLIGKEWSALLKALAGTGLIYVMYKIANLNKSTFNAGLLVLLTFLTWHYQSKFGETFLWTTGAANYLFGALIVITFMYPYLRYYYKENDDNDGILKSCVFFIGGIIAGWTNENLAVSLVFFLIVILVLYTINSVKKTRWSIAGFVGALLGTALLLLAPGNFVRLKLSDTDNLSFYDSISNRFESMQYSYSDNVLLLVIIFLGCFVLLLNSNYIRHIKSHDKNNTGFLKFLKEYVTINKFFQIAILCFFMTQVAFYAMLASPQFPTRALFGLLTVLIIAIATLYNSLYFDKLLYKIINFVLILSLFSILCSQYISAYKKVKIYSDMWKKREQIIVDEKSKGNLDIVFDEEKPIRLRDKMELFEISSDSTHWQNECYVRYYGIKSLRINPLVKKESEIKN